MRQECQRPVARALTPTARPGPVPGLPRGARRALDGRMRPHARGAALAVLALLCTQGAAAPGASAASGTSARTGACRIFPANSYWHADVSELPVDQRSATWVRHMSPSV